MNDAEDNTPDPDLELLRKHSGSLSEHFDSVIIVCTKLKGDGRTRRVAHGQGNWYARYGSVLEWIKGEEELMRKEIE